MTKFAIVTAIMAMVLLGGFIGLSVWRFGLLKSYSAYARKWKEFIPMRNANVWSIVTAIVAILMMPALIERAAGSPLQFFGFLAPVYLIAVAMTPDYQTNHKQMLVHRLMTICCAIGFIVYVYFGLRLWFVLLICLAACYFLIGLPTRSINTSYILWAECAMFSAAFVVIFIPGGC